MPVFLRDACQGQDGIRLYGKDTDKDGNQRNTGAAYLQDGVLAGDLYNQTLRVVEADKALVGRCS